MPGTVYTKASKQVAQALADARKQAGLLQEELARRVGKDQSFVSNIERGQRRIDVLELYAMARAMDRDPSDLYRTLVARSEEHTSELQSLMRISYAVFCLKKKIHIITIHNSFSSAHPSLP